MNNSTATFTIPKDTGTRMIFAPVIATLHAMRCGNCNSLLGEFKAGTVATIKCYKNDCKHTNYIEVK